MIPHRLIARGATITGAILAAYAAGWFIAASVLKAGIANWAVERRADGWIVEHGAITMRGFPFSWRASIEAPRLARIKQNRTSRWSGPAIALSWKPWSPRTVHYSTSGAHKFRLDPAILVGSRETTLEMVSGEGHLIFGPQGRLSQLGVLLDGGRLSLPETPPCGSTDFRRLSTTTRPRTASNRRNPT